MNHTKYDPVTKIWSGPDIKPYHDPDESIGNLILRSLSKDPNKIAQVCDDTKVRLTNKDIRIRSIRVAQHLLSQHYQQEDIIGIAAKNTENLAPVFLGCVLSGVAVNTLDESFGTDEIIHTFGQTQPKLVFCDASNYDVIKRSMEALHSDSDIVLIDGELPGVRFVDEFLKETKTEDDFVPRPLVKGGQQTAVMVCTSGTTGRSKAVCLSHACLLEGYSDAIGQRTDEVSFCFSSLYWMSGLSFLLFGTFNSITRVLTTKPFTAERLLRIIEEHKVSLLFMPPSQAILTLQSPLIDNTDLTSIKSLFIGGSMVPKSILEAFSKYVKSSYIRVGYSMTEVGGACTLGFAGSHGDSVGQVVPNCQVKIIDDDGKSLGIGEVGEICIKRRVMFSGYYGNPRATKETLDSEGWIHSGDIGYFDEEGWLFVNDRKKDIIKYRGYQIYPSEIEEEIYNIPGVELVCVCGVPDPAAGDWPTAAVVKRKGFSLTERDIADHLKSKFSQYKHLSGGVFFFDSLPLTASGKLKRRVIRDMLLNARNKN